MEKSSADLYATWRGGPSSNVRRLRTSARKIYTAGIQGKTLGRMPRFLRQSKIEHPWSFNTGWQMPV